VLRSLGRELEMDLSDVRIVTSAFDARPRPIYLSTASQVEITTDTMMTR
jgi:hypothetical protein